MTDRQPEPLPRPADRELRDEYWSLRSKRGGAHGIVGAQQLLVDKYAIPWSEISGITHRKLEKS